MCKQMQEMERSVQSREKRLISNLTLGWATLPVSVRGAQAILIINIYIHGSKFRRIYIPGEHRSIDLSKLHLQADHLTLLSPIRASWPSGRVLVLFLSSVGPPYSWPQEEINNRMQGSIPRISAWLQWLTLGSQFGQLSSIPQTPVPPSQPLHSPRYAGGIPTEIFSSLSEISRNAADSLG